MNILFVCKNFHELFPLELYRCLQLRSEVFVVEQQCIYQDLDDKDLNAQHLLMYNDELLIGYARLLPEKSSEGMVSIGRVVAAKDYRNKGVGKMLMEKAVEECIRHFGVGMVKISAQVYAIDFYKKCGFEPVGEEYLEDDIPHIKMILNKTING